MRQEIKYIGFYDLPEAKGSRVSTLAAINKMDYIADVINQAGYDVHIVSPSWSEQIVSNPTLQKGGTIQSHPHKKITFCPTFCTGNKITRALKIMFTLTWLFFWLVKNVKQHEKIMVYHVQWLSLPIRLAKVLKRFNLILEVEEFYGEVWKNKSILNKWEQKLIKSADSYIAVSDVLAEILGQRVKAIVYGNYSLPLVNYSKPFLGNDKINVVYAGSIDETKGGAFKAVECAALLPDNYLIHITGSGNIKSERKLVELIEKTNKELSRVACVYHGVINENVFADFLLSCQIALNPQFSGEKFRYLFPSKIIKYMACNLRIVSTAIESIHKSNLSHLITFSEDDQPSSFAKAVMSIDFQGTYSSDSEIQKLNNHFIINLKKILDDDQSVVLN